MSESIYSKHKPSGGSDLYIKLNDGDKIKGRIMSEPAISIYKQGDKPRYSWVVFVREFNDKPVNKAQILTKGVSVYSGIGALVEDWGPPESFDVIFRRTGSGLNDTEYTVTPVKISVDLSEEQLDEVAKIDLVAAIKGKWLADFIEDNELPDPVTGEVVRATSDEDSLLNEAPFND